MSRYIATLLYGGRTEAPLILPWMLSVSFRETGLAPIDTFPAGNIAVTIWSLNSMKHINPTFIIKALAQYRRSDTRAGLANTFKGLLTAHILRQMTANPKRTTEKGGCALSQAWVSGRLPRMPIPSDGLFSLGIPQSRLQQHVIPGHKAALTLNAAKANDPSIPGRPPIPRDALGICAVPWIAAANSASMAHRHHDAPMTAGFGGQQWLRNQRRDF
ncbi:hypothetical protein F5B21DRAFT_499231 [Xylaria acuta]|nr:hypothetical protein F5B21DRAFT_499231 [Xylaria acuta]